MERSRPRCDWSIMKGRESRANDLQLQSDFQVAVSDSICIAVFSMKGKHRIGSLI
jgi:hypothetical protein